MATEVKLPELGENIEEGDVTRILVAVGDTLSAEQSVLEVETGKATIEVPTPTAGVVKEIRVQEGDKARVGQVILVLEESDGAESKTPAKEPKGKAKEPEGEAKEPEGKAKEPAEPAAPEKKSGVESEASWAPEPVSAAAEPPPAEPAPSPRGVPIPAAPSVRKFARELGVDIGQVRGTGPGGRIQIDDVKGYTKSLVKLGGASATSGGSAAGAPLPDFSKWGDVERTAMSNLRRATAEHMARCWAIVPHVTHTDKADTTHLEAARKAWARRAEAAGTKLTPTAMLLKIVASALKVFPDFNASLDVGNGQIVYKKYIHIGVAVDTPKGLVVPVIRNADQKNILTLSAELNAFAAKARDGKLGLDEMQGGTFTITNLGGIGGHHFTPIVNHPEVAILGVSRSAWEPVFQDEEFVPRLMMPLSLSYDHRIIDGANAARFVRWIADAVEEPLLLALEG